MTTQGDSSFFTIRQADPGDDERLAFLCDQLGYPTTPGQARRRLAQIGLYKEDVVFVAVEAGGEVIGWVHVYICPSLVTDLHAELGGLIIDERYQRRGVGRLLTEQAAQWARNQGCKNLAVRSNVIRTAAHEFYTRLGFTKVKTQFSFFKSL